MLTFTLVPGGMHTAATTPHSTCRVMNLCLDRDKLLEWEEIPPQSICSNRHTPVNAIQAHCIAYPRAG